MVGINRSNSKVSARCTTDLEQWLLHSESSIRKLTERQLRERLEDPKCENLKLLKRITRISGGVFLQVKDGARFDRAIKTLLRLYE